MYRNIPMINSAIPILISILDTISQPAAPSMFPMIVLVSAGNVLNDTSKPENPKAANPPPNTVIVMEIFFIAIA